ncbi:hypothetical protein QJS10_CPB20g02034 [Acorus calamus]|uniref:Uncharacterized protein n=1 Tax=Acorus calamus TaxID=4465 RepID=A0AAV9C9K8_ACOCL|nr:hypothetical protein QJS10_CPB20g02034 [Acorus calamus]
MDTPKIALAVRPLEKRLDDSKMDIWMLMDYNMRYWEMIYTINLGKIDGLTDETADFA